MRAVCLFSFVIYLGKSRCFNVDTNHPIVYEDPHTYLNLKSNISTYFGYSVVLYNGSASEKPWVFVGAPRGNTNDAQLSNPGACFKCGIGEKCTLFNIVAQSDEKEKLDGAWIGGAMDINYATERLVTCAHRWIETDIKYFKVAGYYMKGKCYWFHVKDNTTEQLIPLIDNSKLTISVENSAYIYYYGQGQAGVSVHMPSKEPAILMGAPGVLNWEGTAVLYRDTSATPPPASRYSSRRARNANSNEFVYQNIIDPRATTETLAFDLMGYSSTSGYFESSNDLLYVSGAPRSNNYTGRVLVYIFGNSILNVEHNLPGEQFGEYFGGSLTSGNLMGDDRDELVVGAPFYSDKKYNEGKVYIFTWDNSIPSKKTVIVGRAAKGQFGTTVQYLGDIDGDGYGDLAVSAPYEEDHSGVVYLYRGSRNGLETTHCQRIVGRDIDARIRGFGMSISRAVDVDNNTFSDFAVGSHLSGHVVLLRSRPVVTVSQSLKSLSALLDDQTKFFKMSACFNSSLDPKYDATVTIQRRINVDGQLGRARLHENYNKDRRVDLKPNEPSCENFTVKLEPNFFNRYDPITVTLSHYFIAEPDNKNVVYVSESVSGIDSFCSTCYVYDNIRSVQYSIVEIPFALDCGSDKMCTSDLKLSLKVKDDTFVLGSADYVTLESEVENVGENAYLTQVLVTVPDQIGFRSTPSACSEVNSSSVLCSVANPLETGRRMRVSLDVDMTNVNSGESDDSIIFTVQVLTNSNNIGNKTKQVTLKLKREVDVTISGMSEEQSYSYRNISSGKLNFAQIYQVETFGSSNLNEVVVELHIPFAIRNATGEFTLLSLFSPVAKLANRKIACSSNIPYVTEDKQPLISMENVMNDELISNKTSLKRVVRQAETPTLRESEKDSRNRIFYLNCTMSSVVCATVKCRTGPIQPGEVAKFKLKMNFDIAVLQDDVVKDVVVLTTHGRVFVPNSGVFVQSGNKSDSADVGSRFVFVGEAKTEVELWIIILSAIAGLILLLLLIFALVKMGFFKRSTKEDLEQLKKEMENNEQVNLNTDNDT